MTQGQEKAWRDFIDEMKQNAIDPNGFRLPSDPMFLAVDAELTTLRAEVDRLTKEREAERKAIAEALRAEFSDDFGLADRILAGEFAKEDK